MNSLDLDVVRNLVLNRCKEIDEELKPAIPQNQKLASQWGLVHIIAGLATAVCSSLSALFTFSNNQPVVILFAVASAILASGLTFLNPSAAQSRRKTAAYLIRSELNRLAEDRIFFSAPSATEKMMMERLTTITTRFHTLMKDISEFT